MGAPCNARTKVFSSYFPAPPRESPKERDVKRDFHEETLEQCLDLCGLARKHLGREPSIAKQKKQRRQPAAWGVGFALKVQDFMAGVTAKDEALAETCRVL